MLAQLAGGRALQHGESRADGVGGRVEGGRGTSDRSLCVLRDRLAAERAKVLRRRAAGAHRWPRREHMSSELVDAASVRQRPEGTLLSSEITPSTLSARARREMRVPLGRLSSAWTSRVRRTDRTGDDVRFAIGLLV